MIRVALTLSLMILSVSKPLKCTKQRRSAVCSQLVERVCGYTTKGFSANFMNGCLACSHQDIVIYLPEKCGYSWGWPSFLPLNVTDEIYEVLNSPLPDSDGRSRIQMNKTYQCHSFEQFCINYSVCNEDNKLFTTNCQSCKSNRNKTFMFGQCLNRTIKYEISDFLNLPEEIQQSQKYKKQKATQNQTKIRRSSIIQYEKGHFYYYYMLDQKYESSFNDIPQASMSGPWFLCPKNVDSNCSEKNIVVCGSSSNFTQKITFLDYCVACAYGGVQYFTPGRCPLYASKIFNVTNPVKGQDRYGENFLRYQSSSNHKISDNIIYMGKEGQYYYYVAIYIPVLKQEKKIFISALHGRHLEKRLQSQRIQCYQNKIICKIKYQNAVCGIFSYGYNRTFENACAACKHPNVIAYTLKICEPNNYTIIQYSIVAGINETGEECNASAKAECDPKEEKMKLCGMTKSQRLVPYSNHSVCEVCKIKTNVRYFKKDCNLVSQRVISSPKQQAKQYDSFLSFSWNEVKPGYSLQLERGKTMACSQQQRTSECVKRQEKPPPVCGYWGRNMYRTYSSECEACSEVNVGSYSYGECPKEGSVDVKKTNAPMQEFQCRGPLRSVGTCSLRKDPVCYQAPDGSRKSYINNCVACHSESNSPNFTIGGGCYGTDFSMKAVILKMLEIEQHMIQTQQNVEMM